MDKITIDCSCGTSFDVDDIEPGKKAVLTCPSCSVEISFDGSAPPAPSVDDEIEEVEGVPIPSAGEKILDFVKRPPVLIGAGIGGGAILLIVVLLAVFSGEGKKKKVVRRYAPPPVRRDPAPVAPTGPAYPDKNTAAAPVEAVATPAAPPPAPTRDKEFPFALKNALRKNVLQLHPFYRRLCVDEEEQAWIEKAVSVGRGTPGDFKYLQGILDRASVRLANEEKSRIAKTYVKAAKSLEKILPVDRVRFMNGTWVDGVIVEEVEDGVRVRRFLEKGPKIVTYPEKEVRYLLRGRGEGAKFIQRWDHAIEGTIDDRVKFYEWGVKNNLKNYLDLARWRILMDDPGFQRFRKEVGLPEDPIVAAVNAAFARGNILYGQREWQPLELKSHLLQEGHAVSGGKWYSPTEKVFSLPSLMSDESAPATIRIDQAGVEVCEEKTRTYRAEGDPKSPRYRQVPVDTVVRRFLSPPLRTETREDATRSAVTPDTETTVQMDTTSPPEGSTLQGQIRITVDVGEAVTGASVYLPADVKGGSFLEVSLVAGGVKQPAYRIIQRDFEEHLLPAAVRGQSQVILEVAWHAQAAYIKKTDQYLLQPVQRTAGTNQVLQRRKTVIHERMIPDYRAVLLPSWPDSPEAFRLTATVLRPNPRLDAFFARFPGALQR